LSAFWLSHDVATSSENLGSFVNEGTNTPAQGTDDFYPDGQADSDQSSLTFNSCNDLGYSTDPSGSWQTHFGTAHICIWGNTSSSGGTNFQVLQFQCTQNTGDICTEFGDCAGLYNDHYTPNDGVDTCDGNPDIPAICTTLCANPVAEVDDNSAVAGSLTTAQVTGIAVGGSFIGLLLLLGLVLFLIRRGSLKKQQAADRQDKRLLDSKDQSVSVEDI